MMHGPGYQTRMEMMKSGNSVDNYVIRSFDREVL